METKVWRKLTTWLLTLLVAVFLLPTGLQYTFAADGDLPQPQSSKHLYDNGDGTYTLTLDVTGKAQSSSTQTVDKANVILVLDTSSSMNNSAGSVYYPVVGTPRDPSQDGNTPGSYSYNDNGTYRPLYYRNGQWRTTNSNQGQVFSGQFYSTSRLWAEKNALTKEDGVIDALLEQNVPGDAEKSDIIEVAIASFGLHGQTDQGFTTDPDTLKGAINGLLTDSGTNWEEGLQQATALAASIKQAQPDEDVYVIFLTDGEPTTSATTEDIAGNDAQRDNRWDAAKDEARKLITNGHKLYALFTWGNSQREHYLTSLVGYAYDGEGGPNDGVGDYGEYYTNADSTEALIEALTRITHSITNSVGYTNTELTDGVTQMTDSNVKASAGGTVTGVRYWRSGGPYDAPNPEAGTFGTEWTDAPKAVIAENGEIDWKLETTGADGKKTSIVLEDGVTYTMSFVVWPSQESLDLVADLNNGIVSYNSLTDEQKAQIKSNNGNPPYTLKTNTDYPTLTYSTITSRTVDGTTTETVSDPVTVNITNPDPVQLAEEKLNALKLWEDSLDPSQREDVGTSVTLYLKVDGHYYYVDDHGEPMGVTLQESENWEKTDYIAIAPGLMVTSDSPAYPGDDVEDVKYVTWANKKYAIIEDGHDYVFAESESNNHFQLTSYTHHPMIKGETEDGKLNVVDVIFNEDGSIKDIIKLTDSLSATNSLKGGINVTKKVVDETGKVINDPNPFTIKINVTDADGNALPIKETEDGSTEYTLDYRIYYGPNNPNYDEASGGGRSEHIYKTGTSIEETIYVGDTIRVVNVEDGALYTVEETAPTGYELDTINYSIAYGTSDPVPFGENVPPAVHNNSASYAEVVNKYTFGDLDVSKVVEVESGDEEQAKAKEFTFTFKLYSDNKKTTELTGNKYSYTKTDAEGTETTGTITEGRTFTLKDGEDILFEKLPEGSYYEITETAVDGYTTVPESLVASGTIVKGEVAEAGFINTYNVEPVSVDPQVQKEIKGNESLYNKGDFTFAIANTATPTGVTAPMPAKTSITNVAANEVDGKKGYYEFGEITFTAPGTYTYSVTESGSVIGVTNDSEATKTLTFTVTDDGEGNLTVSPTTDQAIFEFTNEYKTGELDITKTVVNGENADLKEFTFTVTLRDAEENELEGEFPYTVYDENGQATEDTGTISSGDTLTLTDKQTAKITEIPDGASYEVEENETNTQGFTTTPSDGFVAGEIVADETQTAAFTNEYEASPTEVSFPVEKEMVVPTGMTGPTDWSYTIDVTAEDGAPEAATMTGTVTKAEPTTSFGPFSFDTAGEYTYTVTETGTYPGVNNDTATKTVTVNVVDNGDGTMTATASATATSPVKFINNYAPGPAEVSFPVEKEMVVPTGMTGPEDWSYTIDVEANGDAPEAETMTGTVTKAEPTTTFGPFSFNTIGEYTYTVTETGTYPGVTNDTAEKTVTITVSDDGSGVLTATATATEESPVKFTNRYEPEPAEVSFPVEKEMVVPTGMVGPSDWSYTIDVEANDGAPEAASMSGTVTKAEPTTSFGPFAFDAAGEYTYTVTETGDIPGVTNDTAEKTVTVTVTDDGSGTLTATADATDENPVKFVNNYDIPNPVNVSIPVEKVMEVPDGMTGLDDWSYDISVAADDSASPVAETMTGVVTKAEPTTTFGPFTFTKADIGTHTYTVSESGVLPGVENDEESEKTVTITVTDKGDGTLLVTKSIGDASVVFTNAYCPGPVKTKIGVKKVIDSDYSHEDAINKEFTFTLTPVDGAPMPEGQEESASVTIKTTEGVGEDFFNEIEYTEMGTYKYKLVEEGTAEPGPGWTYDTGSETKEHEVTVVVADGGNGKLVATVSGGGSAVIVDGEDTGDTEVDITNEYVITGVETKLTLEKVVKDLSNSKPDGTFTFTLHKRDGQTIGDQIGDPQTITVVDGVPQNTVTFEGDAFYYDEPGTYEYAVVESTDITEPGWSYDTVETKNHFYTVVVDPNFEEAKLYVDDEDSTLKASITNEYKAEATNADIVVKKIIEDNSDDSESRKYDRVFTFTLTPGDNDVPGDYATPMPPAGNEITITGEGEAAFEKIPFEKCGVYNYSIKEVVRDGDGYICSTSTYDVVVTVVDESAKLVASVDYSQAGGTSEEESVHVVNYYDPEDAVVALIATKVVTDNTGSAPDETFKFELVDADGNVIETVSRENSGVVKFKEITYSKLGTYKYQIREVAGNTPGFTYDDSVYDVTVTVTDPGKSGVLKAEVTGNNPTFNNPYDVPPGKSSVTDQIEITKKLTGRDLKDGEFTFVLKDSDGKVVGVAKNDASGNVVFPKLTFRKVGSYTYTVYENPGEDADITYDKSIYTTTAVVTDPHTGKSLKVKWTCDEKKITFVNTYEPPEKPKKPDTGDHNNLEGWLTLMALAGAGCGTMVYRRRRYNK